jgi:hypothetical protein
MEDISPSPVVLSEGSVALSCEMSRDHWLGGVNTVLASSVEITTSCRVVVVDEVHTFTRVTRGYQACQGCRRPDWRVVTCCLADLYI